MGMGIARKIGGLGAIISTFNQRLTLPQRFVLVGLAAFVIGMVGIGAWVSSQIEAGVVNSTAATTALFVNSFVAPHLASLRDGGPLSDADQWGLSQLLRGTALGQEIVAFKVWDLNGTVLYSTDDTTTGQTFPIHEGLARAMRGWVSSELSTLADAENAPQRAIEPVLLETYSPVRLAGTDQIIAVAEFYQTVDELEADIAVTRSRTWLIVGGALLFIYLLLVLFVLRVDRTIQGQQNVLNAQVRRLTELLGQVRELDERVRRAAGRTAAVNERFLRRISAELHDGPAQDLALALLRLDPLLARAEAGVSEASGPRPPEAEELQVIQQAIAHSLKEIRAIAGGLSVPELERLAPAEIVRRVAREHERKTATKVGLELARLPREAALPVKITLYRLVQEALSNAFRHAGGVGQMVRAGASAGQLEIAIADAGPGFDDAHLTGDREHLGLVGMRERVESLGGRFRIESQAGRGTQVWAQLPLQVNEELHPA